MSENITLLDTNICFATRDEGRKKISTSDFYTKNLTDFDRKAKIQTIYESNERDYLSNAMSFVRGWTKDEVAYLSKIIVTTDQRLRELKATPNLPKEIVLVKTTGWEEGGANGYTRANGIYLNQNSLSENLFHHELFHIISRYDAERSSKAYQLLGFFPVDNIEFSDPLRITNPDAPSLNHVLQLSINGQSTNVVIIIRSSREYIGGSFFSYVEKKLLEVAQLDGIWHVISEDGSPVYWDFPQPDDLYDNLGHNTGYNIHQEEVTAVHFEYLLKGDKGLPNQDLVTQLGKILQ